MNEILAKVLPFLTTIGIKYQLAPIDKAIFLPGLKMQAGTLCIDTEKLLYPGDVLHEAGHLACMPPEIRQTMDDELENNDLHHGGEIMALCWSYTTTLHWHRPKCCIS